MKKSEKLAIYKFSRLGLTFRHYRVAVDRYGNIENSLKLKPNNWQKLFPKNPRTSIPTTKEKFIVYGEKSYPKLLNEIPSPPLVLYYRGDLSLLKKKTISIVGTRSYSIYGERITKRLVSKLSERGYIFVSGMAMGVDTIVHQTALGLGAKTIAVLPSSLENPEPRSNFKLFKEIEGQGLVISEYPERRPWNRHVYAQRNRIIAGLTMQTIVTEAPIKSGALITANLAFDFNREVYAFPGNIYSATSAGTNWLIKQQKAQLLANEYDLIGGEGEGYEIEVTENQKQILNFLNSAELTIEELRNYVNIAPSQLQEAVLGLELQGIICLNSLGKYIMNR